MTRPPESLQLAVALLAISAAASAAELDPRLRSALATSKSERLAVIIHFTPPNAPFAGESGTSRRHLLQRLRDRARETERTWRPRFEAAGATRLRVLWAIGAISCEMPVGLILDLATLPGIDRLGLDARLARPAASGGAPPEPGWGVKEIHAPALWALGHRGAGVVVATLDSGVDGAHPDLTGRWRGGNNSWFDPYGEHPTPTDLMGHGTGTTGIIVAGGGLGVAPEARWIAAKIFDDSGKASLSAIHLALQWMLDPDEDPITDDAPDVINNSWSLDSEVGQCDLEFEADFRVLRAAGVELVSAAGNGVGSAGTSVSPANYPENLAVGAISSDGAAAPFSARGSSACDGRIYPDLAAPGVEVRTADLSYGGALSDPYVVSSGTSYAAPHVAGAFALLKGAFPGSSRQAIEDALLQAAVGSGAAGLGRGRIDAEAAYRLLAQKAPDVPLARLEAWESPGAEGRTSSVDAGAEAPVFGASASLPSGCQTGAGPVSGFLGAAIAAAMLAGWRQSVRAEAQLPSLRGAARPARRVRGTRRST